ncbi:RbsD/FucU domain-containing protein [Exiguobacterium sp. USCH10]|uniref:RbsD/FucU domain-containing protein n=1 Tax=Exiguobacterium sp. USCH10 TaxID=3024839 RepID=UPI0030ADC929
MSSSHSHLAKIFADLGHTGRVVIADCGLPIPDGVKRVDLSLRIGEPSFLEVLDVVESDLVVERTTIADSLKEQYTSIDMCSHEDFKREVAKAKVVIRTGKATPYANVILHAGVIF